MKEMNRLGMMIDLSHVSPETMRDAIRVSEAPVIFSHSSARGLADHSRNVPDDVLEMTRENRGIVMVTFVPLFLSEDLRRHSAEASAKRAKLESLYPGQPDKAEEEFQAWTDANPAPGATLEQVADHIDYIRDLIGVDYMNCDFGDYCDGL